MTTYLQQAQEADKTDLELSRLASHADQMVDQTHGFDRRRWNEAYNAICLARSAVRSLMTQRQRDETPY